VRAPPGPPPPDRRDPRLPLVTTPAGEDVRPGREGPEGEAAAPDEAAALDEAAAEEEARAKAAARLRRGRIATAVVVGVLVLVVGVVALLGGFERRKDLVTRVEVGSVITTGPYEVTLASGTVQHTTSQDEWDVVVTGTARTTGDTSIAPRTGNNAFVYAKDVRSGEAQPLYYSRIGQTSGIENLDTLTPGLPPVPWALTFRFKADPGDDILLAVFQQEYTTPYIFGDEKGWVPTADASTMTMPLERLADSRY
jgi:hypothetical protein